MLGEKELLKKPTALMMEPVMVTALQPNRRIRGLAMMPKKKYMYFVQTQI